MRIIKSSYSLDEYHYFSFLVENDINATASHNLMAQYLRLKFNRNYTEEIIKDMWEKYLTDKNKKEKQLYLKGRTNA